MVTKFRLAVFLGVVFIVGSGGFLIGRLSSRTASLEHLAKGHEEILKKLSLAAIDFASKTSDLEKTVLGHEKLITELSNTTVTLGNVVEGHYKTLLINTEKMQEDMKNLRAEMLEQTSGVRDDIDKLRSDVGKLITAISALAPSEPDE